jgi:hypothetical protein
MATQLSVIRGDTLCTETVTIVAEDIDFTNFTCTGQIRPHPDGNLLYTFVPTIITGVMGTGQVQFNIPSSVTKSFPPINLYGDIHYYATGFDDRTFLEFRLNVLPDVTHI